MYTLAKRTLTEGLLCHLGEGKARSNDNHIKGKEKGPDSKNRK